MSADKHPAEVLADRMAYESVTVADLYQAADMLRHIPALEAERDQLRAEVERWSVAAAGFEAERNELRAEVARYIRQAEAANAQADKLLEQREELRSEAKSFHMAYRMKCDEETKAQALELDQLRAEVDAWRSKLSAVMPADFKDWHQNSPTEWPEVAAITIMSLQKDCNAALASCGKWADQVVALQGESRVLRSLLAEARATLDTITEAAQEDGGEALRLLLGQIDAALDPSSREAQQMSITEASMEAR